MKTTLKRREFLHQGTRAGAACCALMFCPCVRTLGAVIGEEKEKPDPQKLNYCGYVCPDDCTFLKATRENDVALRKEAYGEWQIMERFGLEFDPEKMFCWGCKAEGRPEGVVLTTCTVRSCVMDKGLDCCIECEELKDCDKDLWSRYPEFREHVIGLQKTYREA